MVGLKPKHFLVPANETIYNAIMYLHSDGKVPTPFSIEQILSEKHKQQLEELGGTEYLKALGDSKDTDENIDYFASRQKSLYTRVQYKEYATKIMSRMDEEDLNNSNVETIVGEIEEGVLDIAEQVRTDTQVYKMGTNAEEKLISRAETPNQILGIATGYDNFDRYTNGLRPGDLVFICARAKMGKSTMLQNMATNIAYRESNGRNEAVLYIDTEMDEDSQEDRILANLTGLPIVEIENGTYSIDTAFGKKEEKKAKVKEALKLMTDNQFYHVYMPDFTVNRIEALARQYQIRHDIKILIFDYIKMPEASASSLKTAQEYQMLGFLASGLKDIAGRLKIPILSACQENRNDVGGSSKDASNVGGSDRILQLATKLCFLYDKDKAVIHEHGIQNGNQELYIAYQRNGSSDCPPIDMLFNRPCLRMEEV